MAKDTLHHPNQSNKIVLQQMPLLIDNVSLVDLVGKIAGHYFSSSMQTMAF